MQAETTTQEADEPTTLGPPTATRPVPAVESHAAETPPVGETPGLVAAAPAEPRRIAVARGIIRLMTRAVPDPGALVLELDDGSGPIGAPAIGVRPRARVTVHGPDAVVRLLWPPTPDAFAEAYLRGDIDIAGDVIAAISTARSIDLRRLSATDLRRLGRWALELRRGAGPPRPLDRVARMDGALHSRARDMAAIRFHYDIGEEFYSLWLDRRMTYSCAYFSSGGAPAVALDEAQEAKLDLVCRKLDLRPGQRLLDIGCGWGSLIVFAAERYGVDAIGVTLSERQAREANRLAGSLGIADRVQAEVRDYRDLAELGGFDAVASIGMFEHVGRANLDPYFRAAFGALRPGGRFLNHGIAAAGPPRGRLGPDFRPQSSRFVERYVFPDGELVPVETAISAARSAGFELFDVQSLRGHYALTLAAWIARLEAHWDAAVEAAGSEVARTWRLYMSAAQLGFEGGDLDVDQLLLGRPAADEPAQRPLRPWW